MLCGPFNFKQSQEAHVGRVPLASGFGGELSEGAGFSGKADFADLPILALLRVQAVEKERHET